MDAIKAATDGDVKTVREWFTSSHTRHRGQVGQVLGKAASNGHDSICRLVLNSGEVTVKDISAALETACGSNQLSTARLFVRRGHMDTYTLTAALLEACVHGHVRIVGWLMSDVMQLSQSDCIKWWLITACSCGDINDIQQLTAQVDSDVTRVMSQALTVACYNSKDNIAKWLISHTTADVNSRAVIRKADGDMTSLMVACNMGYNNIVRRLLQCVTPYTINMMSGSMANTALHFAVCCETDRNCEMQLACAHSDSVIVTQLLYLSNLDLQVSFDYTALHLACMHGHTEIVRMLLSSFVDTHITDDDRRTPAKVAEMTGFTELLPYLRYTLLPVSAGIPVRVSNTNESVLISAFSVQDVVIHRNTCSTISIGPTSMKRSNMKFV